MLFVTVSKPPDFFFSSNIEKSRTQIDEPLTYRGLETFTFLFLLLILLLPPESFC